MKTAKRVIIAGALATFLGISLVITLPFNAQAQVPYGCFNWTFEICPATPWNAVMICSPGYVGDVLIPYVTVYTLGTQLFAWWTMGVPMTWQTGFMLPIYPPVCLDYPTSGSLIIYRTALPAITHTLPYSGSSFPSVPAGI